MQPVKARRAICVGFVRMFFPRGEACGCCQVETLSAVAGIFRAGFHAVLEVFQNMSDIF